MLNKSIYEDGNGGQLVLQSNEIQQTQSLATLAYLLMFGGNVEAETEKENAKGELKFDWWGNDPNKESKTWINSRTEKTLRGIVLNSNTRFKIIEAVTHDVQPLKEYGTLNIEVKFVSLSRVEIVVQIIEPSFKQDNRLSIVWDASRNEIIEQIIL